MKFKFILLFLFTALLIIGCEESEKSVQTVQNPASVNSKYPYLGTNGDQLYMSWIGQNNGLNSLKVATYNGETWSSPQTIASDSTWFVNWADFPSLAINESGPVAAHWLNKKPGGPYSYDVNISFSNSDQSWNEAITPHKDGTATEHGFVSIIPWKDDSILAVWLDGRRTANRADDEYYNINYAMTLRGAIISRDGKIREKFLIDDSVCDCCQTSLTQTPSGAIVAYRNRTDDEIRDIYVSRFDGENWSQPEAVYNDNWKIGACPVNGPKIVSDDSKVALTWFSAAGESPTVKTAFSNDGGQSFSTPLKLNKNRAQGRVNAAIHKGTPYISWMESENNGEVLKLASVKDQKISRLKTISPIKGSRQSGFPQMEVLNDELIFAWTKVDSATTGITTKKLPLPLN